MDAETHYESVKFYLEQISNIKEELLKHQTEYFPEKVRTLIKSYKYSVNKVIEHGYGVLSAEDSKEDIIVEVNDILKKAKKILTIL